MNKNKLAQFFKALGDEHRLYILELLCTGEKCACELLEALDITQPTLSHHMKILCDSELVIGRKDGKWMHYSINCEQMCSVRDMFNKMEEIYKEYCKCLCEK